MGYCGYLASRKRPPAKRPKPTPPSAARDDDAPEIQLGFAPAGRETLAAITAEMYVPTAPDDAPELEFQLVPAGRDTLAAITADAMEQSALGARAPMTTLDYESRPEADAKTGVRRRLQTRGYEEAPVVPRVVRTTTPGVAPAPNAERAEDGRVSRETIKALAHAMLEPSPPNSAVRARAATIEAFELVTFVVRGDDLSQLASEATRREFVAERLLHRLPVSTMDLVDRVDVTPWTQKGSLILRVWCKIRPKAR